MSKTPKPGDLRVWHHYVGAPEAPPFDGNEKSNFFYPVNSPGEALAVINALHRYDEFLYTQNYVRECNKYTSGETFTGLQIFAENEWIEWEDASGDDINITKER